MKWTIVIRMASSVIPVPRTNQNLCFLAAVRIPIRNPAPTDADKLYNITEILHRLRHLNVPVSTIRPEG